ncbi:MAG: cbb3-type cytochrome c oxidase subunit II [candidate division NC10 bacterium]|nr:cbb3-type cytochrome c oxidase subunit II [candidate division NC10 bacterium]MBI2564192.1 cbb3-type cytochrome c oxidase subunit II [candidate division NC10 bacterium]
MERLGAAFLIAGVVTFLLGFVLQGALPMITYRKLPVKTLAEISRDIPEEFHQLAEDYPEEFKRAFGEVTPATFAQALSRGRAVYIAEGCWHCHSQYVRPVSKEDLRFGPVSTAAEYSNELNLPPLFGTRRVGPDLIREAGKHSNDWHVAHFFEPRDVAPYSVMPAYRWFFDEKGRPNRDGLAITTYVQWLGSWVEQVPETIYNVDALTGAGK